MNYYETCHFLAIHITYMNAELRGVHWFAL